MPAAKLYRLGKHHLPVDYVEVVDGYVCKWTKQSFTSKTKYIKHLKEVRYFQIRPKAYESKLAKLQEQIREMYSVADISAAIEKHAQMLFIKSARTRYNKLNHTIVNHATDFKMKIEINVKYNECVSNSHSAPRGKPTNFNRRTDKPQGYPGWNGYIRLCLNREFPGFMLSDVLSLFDLHTGSGGYTRIDDNGWKVYHYELRMYEDDWPNLREKRVIIDKMKSIYTE